MFSTKQLIFAILFFIGFVILISYSYKQDKNLHKMFYKDSYKVLLVFILFIAVLFLIKFYLKH